MRIKKSYSTLLALALLTFSVPGHVFAQQAGKTADSAVKTDEPTAVEDSTRYIRPEFEYESKGKRDPFNSLAPVFERDTEEKPVKDLFNYEKSKLNGIVRTDEDYYALVTDEHEYSFVLRRGYKVFGGYVTEITEDAIKLHLVKYGRSMNIILRLKDSKTTIEEVLGSEGELVKKPGIDVRYSKKAQPGDGPRIRVDDIAVPSLDTKTIDEVWFGKNADVTENKKENTSARTFSLISPRNDSNIDLPFELNWSDFTGASITYSIVFDDDADFSSPVLMKGGLETSAYVLDVADGLSSGKRFYWKVTAHDSDATVYKSRQKIMSFIIR